MTAGRNPFESWSSMAVGDGLMAVVVVGGAKDHGVLHPPLPVELRCLIRLTVVDSALASRLVEAARGTPMELPVSMAIATGMRRGEILGLRWADINGDLSVAHIRQSLQTTGGRLRFEEPKTRRSRRSVVLPSYLQRRTPKYNGW